MANEWWTTEKLYPQVSEAILTANRLEDQDPQEAGTKNAFRYVSILEEFIAAIETTSLTERNLARNGAIRAAAKSGDLNRAKMLLKLFEKTSTFIPSDFFDEVHALL